jgi:hypothetical protein
MKKKKKRYEKPAIISEKVFETEALACAKCIGHFPIFQASCRLLLKKS